MVQYLYSMGIYYEFCRVFVVGVHDIPEKSGDLKLSVLVALGKRLNTDFPLDSLHITLERGRISVLQLIV